MISWGGTAASRCISKRDCTTYLSLHSKHLDPQENHSQFTHASYSLHCCCSAGQIVLSSISSVELTA